LVIDPKAESFGGLTNCEAICLVEVGEMMVSHDPCESNDCEAEAKFEVHWPGKSLKMCEPCRDRANGIAEAMGFNLAIRDL